MKACFDKPDLLLCFRYSPLVLLLGQFSYTNAVPICNTHVTILSQQLKPIHQNVTWKRPKFIIALRPINKGVNCFQTQQNWRYTLRNDMEIAEKACRYWVTCTFKVYFDVFTVGTFLFTIDKQRFVAAVAMIHYCFPLVWK